MYESEGEQEELEHSHRSPSDSRLKLGDKVLDVGSSQDTDHLRELEETEEAEEARHLEANECQDSE